jgi:hypothetical protein
VLEAVPPGVEADLVPFVWTALVAGVCAAAGVLLILVGAMDPPANVVVLRTVFALALWTFLYLLWATFDLVLVLAAISRNRILQITRRSSGK